MTEPNEALPHTPTQGTGKGGAHVTPVAIDEKTRRRISEIKWWHRIQLGSIETPGTVPKATQDWISAFLPSSFLHKSVLDVGAWDGYYSFLAERRGASRVLAIDELQNPFAHRDGPAGFELAKEVLGSHVEYKIMSASRLDVLPETFDVILFLGVYYHVRDPIETLKLLLRRLRSGGLVYLEGLVIPGSKPQLRFFGPDDVEPTTYCGATISGIEAIGSIAGFESTRLLSIGKGEGPIGRYFGWTPSWFRSEVCRVARGLGFRRSWPRAIFELKSPNVDEC